MKKVLIFGSTGQLGNDLADVMRHAGSFEVIPVTHEMADCRDADAVRAAVLKYQPQFVINSVGYVRVDECEDHPAEAFAVNAIGALNIARASAEVDACCVYISTDYVFDGEKNSSYVESDVARPINVYGTSKLAGELLVRQTTNRSLIVRTASLFGRTGARGKGGNFIETIVAKAKLGKPFKVIDDIHVSPTYTRDAATAIAGLLGVGHEGIIHVANSGSCTWYKFACQALDLCHIEAPICSVPSTDFPMRAHRPKNSSLASETLPIAMAHWRDALGRYLCEKGHRL